MDKNFRRWTIGAVIATVIAIYALWWSGSTNGADDTCNRLGIQTDPYCVHNADSHIWWLLLTLAAFIYLSFYIAKVWRVLRRESSRPASPPPPGPPIPPQTSPSENPAASHESSAT